MSTSQLQLRRFRVNGFKALHSVDIRIPGKLTLLIGPNGAGKSSILQALAFVQYFTEGRSLRYFEDRGWERRELRPRIYDRPSSSIAFDILLEDDKEGQILWRF